jgi:hypothetical protein
MTAFNLTTNNEQIAADLKATLETSDAMLISTLKASLNKPAPVEPGPPKTSDLGALKIGLFRDRLRTPIAKTD